MVISFRTIRSRKNWERKINLWIAPAGNIAPSPEVPSRASVLGRQEVIWLADPAALSQAALTSRVRGWPASSQDSHHGGQYQHRRLPLVCTGASRGSDHLLRETASNTSDIASGNREIAPEICLKWSAISVFENIIQQVSIFKENCFFFLFCPAAKQPSSPGVSCCSLERQCLTRVTPAAWLHRNNVKKRPWVNNISRCFRVHTGLDADRSSKITFLRMDVIAESSLRKLEIQLFSRIKMSSLPLWQLFWNSKM